MKNCFFPNVSSAIRKLPYYLYCSARDYDQEEVNRPDGCPWYQLNICRSGKGILQMNGSEREIGEGDSMVIYPGIPHHYKAVKGKMIVSWIAFDGFHVGSFLKAMGIDTSGIYRFCNSREIHNAIGETLNLQNVEMTEQGYIGSRMVYSFLVTMMKEYEPSYTGTARSDSKNKVATAVEYMERHLAEPIGIEGIARSAGVTPQHFCLLFKEAYGQRPFEYLNTLRLNYSKNLLINRPELPLKEVSRLSGYPSHSYYCLLFKKQERLTPAEFRKFYSQESSVARRPVML